jgi:L-fucose mutarotase
MLKNIPGCISPDLMHALMSMGHGDEIVFADADFPAICSQRVIRADGLQIITLLEAILPFFPLDPFVAKPAITMNPASWNGSEPPSYKTFRDILRRDDKKFQDLELIPRFDFYDRAKKAYAIVATGEADGNLILKKGPVAM